MKKENQKKEEGRGWGKGLIMIMITCSSSSNNRKGNKYLPLFDPFRKERWAVSLHPVKLKNEVNMTVVD